MKERRAILAFEHARRVKVNGFITSYDETFINKSGLDLKVVSRYCVGMEFVCLGRFYRGIGFRNDHEGFEFFDGRQSFYPHTVGAPGITVIKADAGGGDQNCLLFCSCLDFLAYKTMEPEKASVSDSIILNAACNFTEFLQNLSLYHTFYCFFPHTVFGDTILKTLVGLFDSACVDCSDQYVRSVALFDSLRMKYNQRKCMIYERI